MAGKGNVVYSSEESDYDSENESMFTGSPNATLKKLLESSDRTPLDFVVDTHVSSPLSKLPQPPRKQPGNQSMFSRKTATVAPTKRREQLRFSDDKDVDISANRLNCYDDLSDRISVHDFSSRKSSDLQSDLSRFMRRQNETDAKESATPIAFSKMLVPEKLSPMFGGNGGRIRNHVSEDEDDAVRLEQLRKEELVNAKLRHAAILDKLSKSNDEEILRIKDTHRKAVEELKFNTEQDLQHLKMDYDAQKRKVVEDFDAFARDDQLRREQLNKEFDAFSMNDQLRRERLNKEFDDLAEKRREEMLLGEERVQCLRQDIDMLTHIFAEISERRDQTESEIRRAATTIRHFDLEINSRAHVIEESNTRIEGLDRTVRELQSVVRDLTEQREIEEKAKTARQLEQDEELARNMAYAEQMQSADVSAHVTPLRSSRSRFVPNAPKHRSASSGDDNMSVRDEKTYTFPHLKDKEDAVNAAYKILRDLRYSSETGPEYEKKLATAKQVLKEMQDAKIARVF